MQIPELDYRSCFTCGVNWCEGHVSLDCFECGGYAMQRPCVHCDGHCEGVWMRDLAASHKFQHAQWFGECKHVPSDASLKSYDTWMTSFVRQPSYYREDHSPSSIHEKKPQQPAASERTPHCGRKAAPSRPVPQVEVPSTSLYLLQGGTAANRGRHFVPLGNVEVFCRRTLTSYVAVNFSLIHTTVRCWIIPKIRHVTWGHSSVYQRENVGFLIISCIESGEKTLQWYLVKAVCIYICMWSSLCLHVAAGDITFNSHFPTKEIPIAGMLSCSVPNQICMF